MTRAHIQEVCSEKVLFGTVTNLYLSHGNKILIFADIIRKAFVTKSVDFTGNNKTVCPNLYEHVLNIKIFMIASR